MPFEFCTYAGMFRRSEYKKVKKKQKRKGLKKEKNAVKLRKKESWEPKHRESDNIIKKGIFVFFIFLQKKIF